MHRSFRPARATLAAVLVAAAALLAADGACADDRTDFEVPPERPAAALLPAALAARGWTLRGGQAAETGAARSLSDP